MVQNTPLEGFAPFISNKKLQLGRKGVLLPVCCPKVIRMDKKTCCLFAKEKECEVIVRFQEQLSPDFLLAFCKICPLRRNIVTTSSETSEITNDEVSGKRESVRSKRQKVLSTIIDMEMETGTAETEAVITVLREKHNLSREETERIIGVLRQEGTIYEPLKGRLKKT